MIVSNLASTESNEYCKCDIRCGKAATHHCQGYGQIYCIDHDFEHQSNHREHFEQVIHKQSLLNQKLMSFISQLSINTTSDLIKEIDQFNMKPDEIEKTENIIREQLEDLTNQLIKMKNGLESEQNGYLEDDIECLRKDIGELKLKLEKINNYNRKRASQEQLHIHDINVPSNNLYNKTKSPSSNIVLQSEKIHLQSIVRTSRNSVIEQADNITVISHQFFKEMCPPVPDLNRNKVALIGAKNKTYLEGEQEMMEVIDSNITSKISQKIHLSNNIVRWLRGPIRIMFDGTMHMFDLCAQGTHISSAALEAVKKGLDKQKKQIDMEQRMNNNIFKPAFTEITSDWTFEGENLDRGFNSVSVWMRDPQGRRILVKTQRHPLCAANEWLVYILGSQLNLPVNEVQIAIYQNNLVTLHTDISDENEKTITFMDLPKHTRKRLLTNPTMGCMDLLDHIVQNVDRNQRNILITMPNTTTIDENTEKWKIHLIDHASCFGMGKLSIISLIACKFHSNHLSVVKFDPIDQARKFEQYLKRWPIPDRNLIGKTLNRFAAITDNQFDSWMTEVQDLLSYSQYHRIHSVLYQQRDIAKRYIIQWSIPPHSSIVKQNQTSQLTSEINDMVTYF